VSKAIQKAQADVFVGWTALMLVLFRSAAPQAPSLMGVRPLLGPPNACSCSPLPLPRRCGALALLISTACRLPPAGTP
jgi:hypothetical protein